MDLLRMEGITKRFGAVLANDHVSLVVRQGAVHALLGENGAGKTTLMNILYGLYQPDEGRILLRGRPVRIGSPNAAIQHGIGMIHQQFMLVPTLTVAENIVLGLPRRHSVFSGLSRVEKQIAALSRAYRLDVDPRALIWQLPVGLQQRVEILKAIYRNADLLILDEPTSVLTPSETMALFEIVRRLVGEGHSVIFISHKLEEVMRISGDITVLRRGRPVATVRAAETQPATLARMMVGREVVLRLAKAPARPGERVLEVQDLHALNDRGLPGLRGVSLAVARGEIFGLAGVDGNGQTELAEVIAGLRAASRGRVLLNGQDVVTRARHARSLAYIPADRHRFGLILDFSVAENLVIKDFATPSFCTGVVLNHTAIEAHARRLVERFDIRLGTVSQRTRQLSGGNQQKVVLAREVSGEPDLIIAMQPTRGLDVGASEYVLRSLLAQRDRGAAVLYISTELDEVMAVSDRVAVLFNGEIMGVSRPEETTVEDVGLMMAGVLRRTPDGGAA